MIRFYITLFTLALTTVLVSLWADASGYWSTPSFYVESLILIVFSTGLLYRYLYKASANIFVQLYLSTIALKIIAYGAYVFLVVSLDKPDAPGNVAFFMVAYIVFTAIEIGFLYRKKTQS